MQIYGSSGEILVLQTTPRVEYAAPQNPLTHLKNGLAMKPTKREEKQLKETQTLHEGKPPIQNLPRTAGVAGWRGQKRPYGKRNAENALW